MVVLSQEGKELLELRKDYFNCSPKAQEIILKEIDANYKLPKEFIEEFLDPLVTEEDFQLIVENTPGLFLTEEELFNLKFEKFFNEIKEIYSTNFTYTADNLNKTLKIEKQLVISPYYFFEAGDKDSCFITSNFHKMAKYRIKKIKPHLVKSMERISYSFFKYEFKDKKRSKDVLLKVILSTNIENLEKAVNDSSPIDTSFSKELINIISVLAEAESLFFK